jgi:hypothetical protein
MDDLRNSLNPNDCDAPALASYEAPRLTPIGNLRDILAGSGSQPCEGMAQAPATGGATPPPTGDGLCGE